MHWITDLDTALAEARQTRRPVWLMFVREGCAGCAKMEATTYRDPRVQAEWSEAFVLLRQDILRDRLVRVRYAAIWTPSFYVLDARGTAHHVELGYLPPDDLRLVGRLGHAKELVPRGAICRSDSIVGRSADAVFNASYGVSGDALVGHGSVS